MLKRTIKSNMLAYAIKKLKDSKPQLEAGSTKAKEWFEHFYDNVRLLCEIELDIPLSKAKQVYSYNKEKVEVEFSDLTLIILIDKNKPMEI